MYSNYPSNMEVQVSMGGEIGSIRVGLTHQTTEVPDKCRVFIEKLGWCPQMTHPDTGEQLFHKPPPNDAGDEEKKHWNYELNNNYWHWYEAIAYEFSKFMGIEEDTGGGREQGSEAMGSAQAQTPMRHRP